MRQQTNMDNQHRTAKELAQGEDFSNRVYRRLLGVRPVELALLLKGVLGVERRWIEAGDLKFLVDPCTNFGQRLITTQVYEPDMGRMIQSLLRPGDCFVDLGGNEGYFSMVASRCVGGTGRVFCIEPQERLWPVIVSNLSANGISNCTIVTDGISNTAGECEITLYPTINSGASSMVSSVRGRLYPKQKIRLDSLDGLISKFAIDAVRAIKIDIEGFELNALRSAKNALTKKIIKNLLIEIHPSQLRSLDQSPEELHELLAGFGYKYQSRGDIHLFSC